jgi:hypothetical protein
MTTATAPSFWASLWAGFQSEFVKIEATLKPLAAKLLPMLEATGEEVATVALNAVAAQAPLVLSGQVKLSAATSAVISTLASQGKSITATNAEAAVQSSFNFLSAILNPTIAAAPVVKPVQGN